MTALHNFLRSKVSELTQTALEDVLDEAILFEIGLDSLQLVELVIGSLEYSNNPIDVSNITFDKVNSIKEIMNLME